MLTTTRWDEMCYWNRIASLIDKLLLHTIVSFHITIKYIFWCLLAATSHLSLSLYTSQQQQHVLAIFIQIYSLEFRLVSASGVFRLTAWPRSLDRNFFSFKLQPEDLLIFLFAICHFYNCRRWYLLERNERSQVHDQQNIFMLCAFAWLWRSTQNRKVNLRLEAQRLLNFIEKKS